MLRTERSEPAGPQTAVSISPERLREAVIAIGSSSEGRCGPYPLVSNVRLPRLAAVCEEVVAVLDDVYADRFDLRPIGEPAETILAFASERDFKLFASVTSRWRVEANGRASAANGYVALAWDENEADRGAATLVHELVHLLNRRALGSALPAWLDEGLADDLADRTVGGKLAPAAWRLSMDRAAEELLPLVEFLVLESDDFYAGRGYSNYAQALLLVRFLADHPQLGGSFRGYLRSLADGAPRGSGGLTDALGISADALEREWRAWVAVRHSGFRRLTSGVAKRGSRAF